MRALVTGGAGFLGSSLVDRLLAEGHAVDVVDDLSTGSLANLADARASGGTLSIHQLDVRERDVVDLIVRRRPDVVFHLAGRAVASDSMRDPVADTSLALLGGLRVLEGARDAAVAKIVVGFSARDLYGTLDPAELPAKETLRGELTAPRGGAERALLDELGLFRSHDRLEFAALAFSTIYGPREPDTGLLPVRRLVEDLRVGRPVAVPGDGSATRDFLFIDDAVDALSRAATHSSGLLLNIGTGRSTSLLALVEVVAAACGRSIRPLFAPWPDGEPQASCLDPSRAGIHLDWRPWTSLQDGVRELLSSPTTSPSGSGAVVR